MNIPDVPAHLARAYELSPGDTGLALGFTNDIIGDGRTVDALSEETGAPKVEIAGLMVGLALHIMRVAVPKLNESINLARALSIEPERN